MTKKSISNAYRQITWFTSHTLMRCEPVSVRSWQMRRLFDLLEAIITQYLNNECTIQEATCWTRTGGHCSEERARSVMEIPAGINLENAKFLARGWNDSLGLAVDAAVAVAVKVVLNGTTASITMCWVRWKCRAAVRRVGAIVRGIEWDGDLDRISSGQIITLFLDHCHTFFL